MRHAFGTCATTGGLRDIDDDVFVSAIGKGQSLGSTDEEASRDAHWGRHA